MAWCLPARATRRLTRTRILPRAAGGTGTARTGEGIVAALGYGLRAIAHVRFVTESIEVARFPQPRRPDLDVHPRRHVE